MHHRADLKSIAELLRSHVDEDYRAVCARCQHASARPRPGPLARAAHGCANSHLYSH
jgi:hypothetical protein